VDDGGNAPNVIFYFIERKKMAPMTEYLLILLIVLIVFAGLQLIKLYHFIKDLKNPPLEKSAQIMPEEYRPSSKKSSPRRGKTSSKKAPEKGKTTLQKKKKTPTKKGKTKK